MSDQCRHCTLRGDIDGCRDADCGHHDNWYALEQQAEIERLRSALSRCVAELNNECCGDPDSECCMQDYGKSYHCLTEARNALAQKGTTK